MIQTHFIGKAESKDIGIGRQLFRMSTVRQTERQADSRDRIAGRLKINQTPNTFGKNRTFGRNLTGQTGKTDRQDRTDSIDRKNYHLLFIFYC